MESITNNPALVVIYCTLFLATFWLGSLSRKDEDGPNPSLLAIAIILNMTAVMFIIAAIFKMILLTI